MENPSVIYHKTLAQKASTLLLSNRGTPRTARQTISHDIVEFADPNVVEGLLAHYHMAEQIGEGGYAIVRRAINLSNKLPVAVKVLKTDIKEDSLAKITREIQIIHIVDFEFCVTAIESRVTKDAIYIVMEFLAGGDLLDAIVKVGSFPEQHAKKIIHNILAGISYLHEIGICHRDLKPENVLHDLDTDTWKIADFGCSTWCAPEPEMKGFEGTIQYMAPELFTSPESYTKVIDLWAAGVVTYVVLSGLFPWQGQVDAEIQEAICSNNLVFYSPEFDGISSSAKDFIHRLLEPEAPKRLTIEMALSHPWIQ